MPRPVPDEAIYFGLLGKITKQLDPLTEGDPIGVLVSLMAGFSAYIGHGPSVQTGKGDSNLQFWTVLVGQSGLGRKGTATGIASRVLTSAFGEFAESSVIDGLPATGLGLLTELVDRAEGTIATPALFIEEEMDMFINNAGKDPKVGVYLRKAWDGQTLAHRTSKVSTLLRRPHLVL